MATSAHTLAQRAHPYALAAAAVCLNAAVTLPLAAIVNVWQDDAYTLHSTASGVSYAFREAAGFEQNAPLYFVAMAIWRELDASAPFARLFSVICIAAAVALLPALAARYMPRANARAFVIVTAINPFLIWAALEIRAYAAIILFSALLLLFFYDGFLRPQRSTHAQLLYAVCAAAGLYTQYYLAFTIAAQGVYLLFAARRAIAPFIVSAAAAAVTLIPLVLVLPSQVSNFRGGFAGPHSPLGPAREIAGALARYVMPLDFLPYASRVYVLLIVLGVIAAAICLARGLLRRPGDGAIVAIVAIACALFDAALFAAKVHLLERHAASLAIPAAMAAVGVLTYLPPRARDRAVAAWLVCVALCSVVTLAETYSAGAKAGDWARVASYIRDRETPGEPIAVFQAENALPFEYYYRGPNRVIPVPRGVNFKTYDVTDFVVRDARDLERVLPRQSRRLWWIQAGDCTSANISFGCGIVEDYLASHYRVLETARFYKSTVRLLQREPAAATATFASCPVFTPDDAYNRRIADDPADAHSAQYIAAMIRAGNTGGFWVAAQPVEFINVATASTPMRAVRPKVPYHAFPDRYPWQTGFKIEPLSDAHAIVVQQNTCTLYESYDTSFDGVALAAYSGAVWKMRAPFAPLRPGTPSAMASGLSLFAGAVRFEEVRAGRVLHALNWAAPAGTVSQDEFVPPASDTDNLPFRGQGRYRLPYGARLRLRPGFDTSAFGPQSAAIAQALKHYGILLADTGSSGNALYTVMPLDGIDRWDAGDLASLERIHISDFDVVALPPVQRVPR